MDRNTEQSKRLNFIDFCKALGITFVVLGHVYNAPEWLYTMIYSFHMPLFFVLTGFTFNREKNINMGFGKYIKKIAKQYLLPYYLFAFLNFGLQILWNQFFHRQITLEYLWRNLKGIFFCYSNMNNMPNCSPLWFLICLFVACLLFWMIMRLKKEIAWIPVTLCILLNAVISPYVTDYTSFPLKIPTALMAVFFLYVGYNLRALRNKYQRQWETKPAIKSLAALGLLTISFAVVLIANNNVGMNENEYGNRLIFLVTATIISVSLIFLSDKATFLHNKYILWLGKNTIYFVAINYICRDISVEVYYLTPFLRKVPLHWISSFVYTFLLCVLGTILLLNIKRGCAYIINKCKPTLNHENQKV